MRRLNRYHSVNLYVMNLGDSIDDKCFRQEFSLFGCFTSEKKAVTEIFHPTWSCQGLFSTNYTGGATFLRIHTDDSVLNKCKMARSNACQIRPSRNRFRLHRNSEHSLGRCLDLRISPQMCEAISACRDPSPINSLPRSKVPHLQARTSSPQPATALLTSNPPQTIGQQVSTHSRSGSIDRYHVESSISTKN